MSENACFCYLRLFLSKKGDSELLHLGNRVVLKEMGDSCPTKHSNATKLTIALVIA